MADNVAVTAGTGTTIAADEVTDGTLGTVKVQYVKIMDGTLDSTTKAAVGSNGLKVDPSGVTSPVSLASVPSHAVTNAGTFAVQNTAATPAGANIVGKVGIDQTTDGTTNLVAAKQNGTWTVQPGNTANTTPWLAKLNDGTNAFTVRAGSSLPATSDTAIVVTNRDSNVNGRATSANSTPVVPSYMKGQYVAASSSAQQIGTGASTDYLEGIWIIPATAAAGAVSVLWDGTNTRTVFAGGGTTALPTLAPFFIGFGFESGNSGGWKITTGSNVAVVAVGDY